MIFVIRLPSKPSIVFSSQRPFYSQPNYSSCLLGSLWCLFRAINSSHPRMWTKTIEWPRPPLYFRQYLWKSCVYWLLTKLLVSQMAGFYLLLVMTNVVCPYFSSDEGSSQVFVPFVCVSMKHHSVRCLSSESGSVLRYCSCVIKFTNMRSWNQKLSKCIDLTSLPLSHAHVDTRTRTQTQRRTRTHT